MPISGYSPDEAFSNTMAAGSAAPLQVESTPNMPIYNNQRVMQASNTGTASRKGKKFSKVLVESKSYTKGARESKQKQYIND